MIVTIFQILCITLVGIAFVLAFLDLKLSLDGSYFHFGISIILLCSFCAIDLWKQPLEFNLKWTTIQHALFCFIPFFMVKYLAILTKMKNQKIVLGFLISATVFCLLFISSLMLYSKEGIATPTILYKIGFVPYTLFSILYINFIIVKNLIYSQTETKKMMVFHFIGTMLLSVCGMIDLYQLLASKFYPFFAVSSSMIGTIAMGYILTYSFADQLVQIINERNSFISQIVDMESKLIEKNALTELGKSSAKVHHDIKNYTFSIAMLAKLIQGSNDAGDKAKDRIKMILESVSKISNYSQQILEYTRVNLKEEGKPIQLIESIDGCIDSHYSDKKELFEIINEGTKRSIIASKDRIDKVFLNMFKNSFEAGANKITISINSRSLKTHFLQ